MIDTFLYRLEDVYLQNSTSPRLLVAASSARQRQSTLLESWRLFQNHIHPLLLEPRRTEHGACHFVNLVCDGEHLVCAFQGRSFSLWRRSSLAVVLWSFSRSAGVSVGTFRSRLEKSTTTNKHNNWKQIKHKKQKQTKPFPQKNNFFIAQEVTMFQESGGVGEHQE